MIDKKEWNKLKKKQNLLRQASAILNVKDEDLPRIIERFQNEIKEMEKNFGKL
ncbi:MAG: hypothetical protein J7J93_03055 [Candidatus Aenigmarchaeota archaeon]|nr:hypothetical protein [Candidatus Aenigmarchaeota archaeon]